VPHLPIGDARVGIVLGSGAGGFARRLARALRTSFSALRGFPAPSIAGHAGELIVGRAAGVPVAVLSGRVHAYEGHSFERVVHPVRALARAGVRAVVLTNAAGAVRAAWRPGDLMLVADHLNGFGANPLAGPNDPSLGPRFPDMTGAYDPALRRLARAAARRLAIPLRQGVYAGVPGPSYETPAEVRMWRTLGADAIGMSTVPEVIVLRHASVRVLAISLITNMAAGIGRAPLDHDRVLEAGERAAGRLGDLLEAVVPLVDRLIED